MVYLAAQDLGTSSKMLRERRGKKEEIRDLKKRSRRIRDERLNCGKEEEMKRELSKALGAERAEGGGVSHEWLVRRAQEIIAGSTVSTAISLKKDNGNTKGLSGPMGGLKASASAIISETELQTCMRSKHQTKCVRSYRNGSNSTAAKHTSATINT